MIVNRHVVLSAPTSGAVRRAEFVGQSCNLEMLGARLTGAERGPAILVPAETPRVLGILLALVRARASAEIAENSSDVNRDPTSA